jgi:hypothetical protein
MMRAPRGISSCRECLMGLPSDRAKPLGLRSSTTGIGAQDRK